MRLLRCEQCDTVVGAFPVAACLEPFAELSESQEALPTGWLYQRGAMFPYWPAWLDPNGDDA